MKEVMQQFEDRTSQRFHEYDERMKTTRQKCKDKCDKEIQKIILKDKLEKELMDKFATLQTDIQSDSIPTCVCEKSLADKTEKFCHNCGYGLGSVAPSIGLLGGPGIYGWKTAALAAATKDAITKGLAAGEAARIKEGINAVIAGIKSTFKIEESSVRTLESIINTNTYTDVTLIRGFIQAEYSRLRCGDIGCSCFYKNPFCKFVNEGIVAISGSNGGSPEDIIETIVEEVVEGAKVAAKAKATQVAATEKLAIETAQKGAIEAASTELYTTIAYSITAILIIVLIMVIIYKILRYRRKKKMKKKLQYIKLLKE
ncbi:hypothetical protein PFMALIP_02294 [Plasmodium falciparum MaliPS096_E11]|uniref:Surface antigen n=1 Tax=Plasmodium falciparum MaliPS096_E11 TaxID=1036727 RepID=A0A024WT28_PLAFA|nr:hypothetical protein PFMALIP_02294 [Plasmodium falciparum MaliPS096_E11]